MQHSETFLLEIVITVTINIITVEDSSLLGSDAVRSGMWVQTFRRTVLDPEEGNTIFGNVGI
jgi:hypothetical protein